jgi:pimeloyl-ACP methyl ester carboxylesterase
MKRRAKIALKGVAVAILAGIVAGSIYEQIGRRQDRKRIPQIGRSVDIGGRSLNIYCSGDGAPAVVFDSGLGAPGYSWVHVQRQVAKFTQACWYDRAGYGWSDPAPYPHASADIAKDLHALLHAAGVPPPYLLVGASFGGFNVRLYNRLFPDEVAGAVFVDAAHEDEGIRIPRHRGRYLSPYLRKPLTLLILAANEVGLVRLFSHHPALDPAPKSFTPEEWSTDRGLAWRPSTTIAVMKETASWNSADQVRAAGGFGDRPVIVLTAGKPMLSFGDPVRESQNRADQQVWIHELQAQLARLSTHGRQIVVENSDHGIQFEAPEVIIEAISGVVSEIRRTRR